MSCQRKQGIVPQLLKPFELRVPRLFFTVVPACLLLLIACSSVQLKANKPTAPETLEQARAYVANHDKILEYLDYELNEQSRACYNKFFVSSCLDNVRLKGAEIRRSHLEVQGKAEDMIRLHDYANRKSKSPQ